MKSGIRIFSRNNFKTSKGLLLPIEEFRFNRNFDVKNIAPEHAEAIVARAEKNLDYEITAIPLSLFRDKYLTGNRSRYEVAHHERRGLLLYLILAELYENKGRFVEKIADFVWAIMEESSWVIPAHQGNSLMRPGSDVPEI